MRALLLSLIAVTILGCGKEAEEAPGATADTEVGRPLHDLELPVSLRNSDAQPSGAATVEATDEQLRLDGSPVIALDRGAVPDADQQGGIIPKLDAALRSSTRSTLALRLQANVPYQTVALAMNTAKKAGIHNVAFQVRQPGASDKTGWLSVNGFTMVSKGEDLPTIPGTEYMSWNSFTDKWQDAFDGCRTSPSGNCAYVNENVAEGGSLRIELFASGRGLNVNYFRRGLSREQEAEEEKARADMVARKKEDFLQGRITEDEMVEVLLLGRPSTYALFQFRYQEGLKAPSALQQVLAPVCNGPSCGLIVTADKIAHYVRVASMIGAAYPNGTALPKLAFEMPWTEREKPADLAAFIESQQQQ